MKKGYAWILAVLMLFAMTACATPEPPVTNPPGSDGPSKPIMTEPPTLTVAFGAGDTFNALTGTYTWDYDTGNENWSGTCADSLHPLQMQDYLTPMETTVDSVELQFEVPPQNFSVRCWSDTNFGNMNSPAEKASVTATVVELKNGGYIYEVEATWSGENLAVKGTVHYVFHVIKHSVQFAHDHAFAETSETVDDPVRGYCGNTVTKIMLDGQEYSFMGTDSVALTDLLINLSYDPQLVCKCLPDFDVETEFGTTYGISLSGYARCESGQANLTEEQISAIQEILNRQTTK